MTEICFHRHENKAPSVPTVYRYTDVKGITGGGKGQSQPLVVKQHFRGVGHFLNFVLQLGLHGRGFDGGLMLEDGATHGGGEGQDETKEADLDGGVGPRDPL